MDVFYVGWKQRSESFLNAGYDVNTPNAGKQFYWLNGEWNQSQVPGSIMIRPVVGGPLGHCSMILHYKNKEPYDCMAKPGNRLISILKKGNCNCPDQL
jgi:hypothetical protein